MRSTATRSLAAPLLGVLVLGVLAALAVPAASQPADWWHTDYAVALKEAKEKALPVLVVFR
jgi:hypothetical protein